MSNPGGRPCGSRNQPGHAAGGSRPGAGRPKAKKCRTDSLIPKIHTTASSSKSASVTSPQVRHNFSIYLFIRFIYTKLIMLIVRY